MGSQATASVSYNGTYLQKFREYPGHGGRMRFLKNLKIRTKSLLVPAMMAGGMILLGGLSLKVLEIQKTLLVQVVNQDLAKIDTLSLLFSQLSTTHVQIFDL